MDALFDDLKELSLALEKRVSVGERKILDRYGLSPRHAPYIVHLAEGIRKCCELTRAVGFDKANTTRVVQDLIAAKLAAREGAGIVLTPLGREAAHALDLHLKESFSQTFSVLSKPEISQFSALIAKLKEHLS